ncbi:MAG: hypothetical protein VYD90_12750 [Pseudomonadota bacterium]|nr:hypothetical protein [Pseudomonadota bacterium]
MEVYATATEVIRMANMARELSTAGPGLDVARAMRALGKAAEILAQSAVGGSERDADD